MQERRVKLKRVSDVFKGAFCLPSLASQSSILQTSFLF